jgi:glycogen debranching enzyme
MTGKHYIATKASPSDRTRVLKYGKMFAIFDRLGDIQQSGLGELGLFFQGTRHLSEFALRLWDEQPMLLSSDIVSNDVLFKADLSNLDVSQGQRVVIPRGVLHLQRSKFLWRDVTYEELTIVNYSLSTVQVPFSFSFDADFADIFEVRGISRRRRGVRLMDQRENDRTVMLSYRGLDDVLRRTRISCDPAPDYIAASELHYNLEFSPAQSATFRIEVACDPPENKAESVGYERAFTAASSELANALVNFPQIQSSNSRFNDWMNRSTSDLEMMIVGNPEGNYPYAGVPWFNTVFGRDGIITSLQTLWAAPWIARDVLTYLAANQADKIDSIRESEPGKILHEMRRGEMADLGEVPFGFYYGSVDSTPLFVMLAGAYFDRTGDLDFARKIWPNVQRALDWIDNFGDRDNDGFVEYARSNEKGLVQQGWKDSDDSVFHSDGSIAPAPIALCEVQGYVFAAKLVAASLCEALGNFDQAATLRAQAEKLKILFESNFWCEEIGTYALALDGDKRPCEVLTSNPGHCLFTGIANKSHGGIAAQTLMTGDSFSGWGIRTVALGEPRYNPLSYHDGSVWPHDSSIVAAGLAKYGAKKAAGKILLGLLDASQWTDLRRLPELFCGIARQQGEGPTLYPVSCSPQAWSAGAAFLLVQATLGMSVRGGAGKITFTDPHLPEGIPQLWIKNLSCGENSVDLLIDRLNETVKITVTRQSGQLEVEANSSDLIPAGAH